MANNYKVISAGTILTFASQEIAGVQYPVVLLQASGTGELNTFSFLNLLSAAQQVKAGAGALFGYYLANNLGVDIYIKIYDQVAAPDPALVTPKLRIPLGANQKANLNLDKGLKFTNGMWIRCSTGIADNDAVSPAANSCVVNLFYT